ncbi:hypothetical protein FGIG_07164 [Fasciola gigantica]|uniref:Lysophosphatidic acid phosphatase type 6 n=1 Tax=Fasciola gigantica TaxID=46835 RepID=A0A504YH02_FASGI|nr:hypothetical protein FGIG_07164 [Fasciola gigantica]
MGKCMRLLQVQTYFRHGARTPLHHVRSPNTLEAFWVPEMIADLPCTTYPNRIVDRCGNEVPNALENNLPLAFRLPGGLRTGELTTQGQVDAYELGKRLKQSYVDQQSFISRTFCTEEIYLRSSLIGRTLKSVRCVAAGIFGDSYKENGKTDILNIFVEPLDREYIFPNPSHCGILGKLYKEGVKEYLSLPNHLEMKRKLRVVLGVDRLIDDFRLDVCEGDCPIYFVRDDYVSRERAGFPLPPGLDLLLPEMHRLAAEELSYELLGSKREWKTNLPLVMAPVFQMIVCNMRNFENVPKFQLYSCHDSTLLLLLLGLGCFDGVWPPFAADVVLELYASRSSPCPTSSDQRRPRVGDCPGENSTTPNPEPEPPVSVDDLWVRVLYLGRVVPLACLWKLNSVDIELASDGYVSFSALVDHWSDALAYKPELQNTE